MASVFVTINNDGILETSDSIISTNITSTDISSNTLNITTITSGSQNILFDNKNLTTIGNISANTLEISGNISANTLEISNITSNSQDNILFNKNILIGITNNSNNYGLLIYNKELAIQNSSTSGSGTTLRFIHGIRTVSNYLNSNGNMFWAGSQSNYNFDKQLIINTSSSGYELSNGIYSYNLPSSNGTLLSYDTSGLLSKDNITLNGNITFEGYPSSPNKTLNLYGTGHYIKAYFNDNNHDGVEIKGWSIDKDKSAVRFLTGNTHTSTDSNNITLMNMYYDRIRSYKKLQISQFEIDAPTPTPTSLINTSSKAKDCHLFIGGAEFSTLSGVTGGSTKIGFGFIRDQESTVPAYIGIRQEMSFDQTKASIVFATRDSEFDNNPTTERMCITSDGDVGIGTNNPSAKLHVDGNVYIENGSLDLTHFGSPSYIGKAVIGNVGHNSNYAGFANRDLTSYYNDYALLQEKTGQTFLNCKSGTSIRFRQSNSETDMMLLQDGNLHVNGTIIAGGNIKGTDYLEIQGILLNKNITNVIKPGYIGSTLLHQYANDISDDAKNKISILDMCNSHNYTIEGGGNQTSIILLNLHNGGPPSDPNINVKYYSGIDFRNNWANEYFSDNTNPMYTKVSAYIRYTPTNNWFRGALDFGVNNATDYNTDATTAMRISDNGNVGIGTTTPNAKLDVNGNIRATGTLNIIGDNTTDGDRYIVIGGEYDVTDVHTQKKSRLYFGSNTHGNHFNGGPPDRVWHAPYYIGTNPHDIQSGSYNLLDISWYTGIRIGATPAWGGVRIYNNTTVNNDGVNNSSDLLLSIGNGDNNTIVQKGNLGIGKTPSAKLHVDGNVYIENGSLDLTHFGSPSYIGKAVIGNVGHNSNYAGFANKDVSSYWHDYALLQENTGQTLLNCKSGQTIRFRQGNSDMMLLQNGNLDVNGTIDTGGTINAGGNININTNQDLYLNTISNDYNSNTRIEFHRSGQMCARIGFWSGYHKLVIENQYGDIQLRCRHPYTRFDCSTDKMTFNLAAGYLRGYYFYFEYAGHSPGETFRINQIEVKASGVPMRATSFDISSDDRLKINEELIQNATNTLLKLRPQIYDKKKTLTGTETFKEAGLIAQEVYYEIPELRYLVNINNDASLIDDNKYRNFDDIRNDPDYNNWGNEEAHLNYIGLIPYLIQGFKEENVEIEELKTEVSTLKQENIQQQTKIETLEAENNELKLIINKLKIANSFEEFKNSL